MKFIFGIIVLIVTLVIVSDNMISFEQSKEDFKTDYQSAQKEFNKAVDNYYKEDLNSRAIPHNEASINEKNSTVARVDTKIAVQKAVNKEKKVYKDDFDRSFEKFDKEFEDKWKNF